MLENSKILLIIFFNHDNINQNLKNKAPYNLKTPSVTALGVSEWLQAKTLTRKNKSLQNSSVLWTPFIVWATRLELATSTTPTAPCAFFASFLVRIVRFCKPNRTNNHIVSVCSVYSVSRNGQNMWSKTFQLRVLTVGIYWLALIIG